MCTNEGDMPLYTYGEPLISTTTVQVLVEVSRHFLGIRGSFGQLAFLGMMHYLETMASSCAMSLVHLSIRY